MNKISEAFQNKKAFVGFLTAGDPSLDKTAEFILTMQEAGAASIAATMEELENLLKK